MNHNAGAITCARYAFAPNYYHYCGPETEGEFNCYVKSSVGDQNLDEYLTRFETLYPYLQSIAQANGIQDPFDERVVEAYWVGNSLLNRVKPQDTYIAFTDGQQLRKRLDKKSLQWLLPKIDQRAKLHHSFHVFNIFTQTGHRMIAETTETMDQCRIGWGMVIKENVVDSQQLVYTDSKLSFKPRERRVINPIEGLRLEVGDWVSFHWGYVCEKLTLTQVKQLKALTEYHLALANTTL